MELVLMLFVWCGAGFFIFCCIHSFVSVYQCAKEREVKKEKVSMCDHNPRYVSADILGATHPKEDLRWCIKCGAYKLNEWDWVVPRVSWWSGRKLWK